MSEPESSKKRKEEYELDASVDQKRSFVPEKEGASADDEAEQDMTSMSELTSSREDVSVEATRQKLGSNTVQSDTSSEEQAASSLGSGYDSDSEPEPEAESKASASANANANTLKPESLTSKSKLKSMVKETKAEPTAKTMHMMSTPATTNVKDLSSPVEQQVRVEAEEKQSNVAEPAPAAKIFGTGFTSMSFGSLAAASSPFSALSGNKSDSDQSKGTSFLDQHPAEASKDMEPQVPSAPHSLSRSTEDIMTGEEEELHIYQTRGKLYMMPLGEGKEWKERGIGLLHLNQNIHDQRRGRLVMRSEGNLKLILNAVIYETMKFEKIQDRHVRFVSVENEQPCVYLLKLKNAAEVSAFIQKVEQFKSKLVELKSKNDE